MIIFPPPGTPTALKWTQEFNGFSLPLTYGNVALYDLGITEVDTPIYVSSQYNVNYDIAKWYTFDWNEELTPTITNPVVTQTLYFNNVLNDGLRYINNTHVKISYAPTGMTKIITVKNATPYGITFDLFDGLPILNTSGLRLVNVTTSTTTNPILSNLKVIVAPGSTSTRWNYGFNSVESKTLPAALTPFSTTDVEVGNPIYVNSQYNVIYDVLNWYITENQALTSTTASSASQTLYIDNVLNTALRYRTGYKLKVTYPTTGFSGIITLTSVTTTSITFNTIDGFPVVNTGPLRLVNVTTDVYPRSSVLNTVAPLGASPNNLFLPRENLCVVENLINQRGFNYNLNRQLAGPILNSASGRLETFSIPALSGDISLALTSQSLSYKSTTNNIVQWYTYDQDIVTSAEQPITSKTIYFATQPFIPFQTGATVRLRNTSTGYSSTFTVLYGTLNSVVLDRIEAFITNGTYVDNLVNSVWLQSNTVTTSAPTNARENLYYLSISPFIRSDLRVQLTAAQSNITTGTTQKQIEVVKGYTSNFNLGAVPKYPKIKIQTFEMPAVTALTKQLLKVRADLSITATGTIVKPIARVTTVAIPLISTITAFKNPRNTVFESPTVSKFPKQFEKVASVALPLVSKVDKLKSNISTAFETPVPLTVSKQLFKLAADKSIREANALPKQFISVREVSAKRNVANLLSQFTDAVGNTTIISYINTSNSLLSRLSQTGILSLTGTVIPSAAAGFTSDPTVLSAIPSMLYYNNILETKFAIVTGQSLVYDVPTWYIKEDQVLLSAIPAPSATQTLYFNNPTAAKLFYTNNYIKITQASTNFSATVQILYSTMFSVTFSTITGFPSTLVNMIITSSSSPVYTKSQVINDLSPFGIIIQTTLPRENLLAVESSPNLRGYKLGVTQLAASTERVRSSVLSTFVDSKISGDFKLQVIAQSTDRLTATENVANWVTFEQNNILTVTTVANGIKTVYFNPQTAPPYAVGSTIKITTSTYANTFTVLASNRNSVTFAQPTTLFVTDGTTFIESSIASVYPQSSVLTISAPVSPRENLYYSNIKPLFKTTFGASAITSALTAGVTSKQVVTLTSAAVKLVVSAGSQQLKVTGDSTKVIFGTSKLAYKAASDASNYKSGNLAKTVTKLTSDTTIASRTVLTVTTTPTVVWTTVGLQVHSINGYDTNPLVSNWYIFDGLYNSLLTTYLNPATLTLNFGINSSSIFGNQIRIIQPLAGYDQILPIVSYTSTTVTITNPGNFPNISGMYAYFGRNTSASAVTYTNTNTVPMITVGKQIANTVFTAPMSSNLEKQIAKLTSDKSNVLLGTLSKQLFRMVAEVGYATSTSTSTTTSTVTWYPSRIDVYGVNGYNTIPPVSDWYIFDGTNNTILSTYSSPANIVLYTGTSVSTGTVIRVIQPLANYDQTFTVTSYTTNSVTFANPGNFPSISGMYFFWGRTTTTTTASYTNTNKVPVITKVKQSVGAIFEAPASSKVSTPLFKLTADAAILSVSSAKISVKLNADPAKLAISSAALKLKVISDTAIYKSGNLAKQLAKLTGENSYPAGTASQGTPTTSTIWSQVPIAITGRTGISTSPSIADWYAIDGLYNAFQVSATRSLTVTLYTELQPVGILGNTIRIVQPIAGFDQTFTSFTYTSTSITITLHDELPNISGMYFYWGRTLTTTSVSYSNTNKIAQVSKLSIKVADTRATIQTSKVLVLPTVRADSNTLTTKPRLETFDNIGATYGPTFTASQVIDNIIPVTGITPSYADNFVETYTLEIKPYVTITPVAVPTNITLYFGPTSLAIGSTIILVQPATQFKYISTVLSKTPNSVTIANINTLPSISGMYIYFNTTLVFDSQMYIPFGAGYVTVKNTGYNYSITEPVVSGTVQSVTFVNFSLYNLVTGYPITINSASVPVFSSLQQSTTSHLPRDRYNASLRTALVSSVYSDATGRYVSGADSKLVVSKLSLRTLLAGDRMANSRSVLSTSSTSSIRWLPDTYIVTGRSGIDTNPSVPAWYTFDEIYNQLAVTISSTPTITLYTLFPVSVSGTSIRLVQPLAGYDQIFSIVSILNGAVVITNPGNLPNISGMYMYIGQAVISTTVTYTNPNTVPVVSKISLPATAIVFEAPRPSRVLSSATLRGDRTIINTSLISKTKQSIVGFETPSVSKVKTSIIVRADLTITTAASVLRTKITAVTFDTPLASKLKASLVVKADATTLAPAKVKMLNKLNADNTIITAKQLEPFYNVTNVVENLTPIISSTDRALLITGRTDSYTFDVAHWYTFDDDVLTLLAVPTPQYITLSFTNIYGITIGSTVKLVQYDLNYFKTVAVYASTPTSITVLNKDIPISGLYIYESTILGFAVQPYLNYLPNTQATLTFAQSLATATIQVIASTISSVTFVKTTAFNTTIAGLSIYNSNPSYYPQVSVNTLFAPVSPRERLFYSNFAHGKIFRTTDPFVDNFQPSSSSGLLSNTIAKLKGDISYPSRSVSSIVVTPTVKWSGPYPVSGIVKDTAQTAYWYTFDQDVLTASTTNASPVTLFLGNIPLTENGLTIRLVSLTASYDRTFTVVSNTSTSVTIANPGNLPSISKMVVYWGYPTVESAVNYTINNNTANITIAKFKTAGSIETPKSNLVAAQYKLAADPNWLKIETKINRFTARIAQTFDAPTSASVVYKNTFRSDLTKLTIDGIAPKTAKAFASLTSDDFLYKLQDAITISKPTTPREYLYFLQITPGKYGQLYIPAGARLGQSVPQDTIFTGIDKEALTVNPDLYTKYFQNGIPSMSINGVYFTLPQVPFVGSVDIDTPRSLSNYDFVPTPISSQVIDQPIIYDVTDWYINDKDVLPTLTLVNGSTQSIYFRNDGLTTVFYTGHYVTISQPLTGFSRTVQVLKGSYNYVIINSIVDYPTNNAPIIISNITYPVYSKTKAYTDLVQFGIPGEVSLSLPRENLVAVEVKPNRRGVTFDFLKLGESTVTVSSDKLEVFTSSILSGDDSIAITNQSPDVYTVNPNTVDWYLNDLDILTFNTVPSTIKTLYFKPQVVSLFAIGSTIKVTNGLFTGNFVVTSCTVNSVSFAQPGTTFISDKLYVSKVYSTLYPQASVVTISAPTNPRENLYYSNIKPLSQTRLFAGDTTSKIASGQLVNRVASVNGEPAKLTVDRLTPILAVTGEPTKFSVSNFKLTPRLVSDRTYVSKSIASTSSSSVMQWSAPTVVSGRTGFNTNPTIADWYVFDERYNTLDVISLNATLVTLYVPVSLNNSGTVIRLVHTLSSYDRTFTPVSYTSGSVTIVDPGDLPSISNMLLYWGLLVTTTTITLTDTNTTPFIKLIKQRAALATETPIVSALQKSVIKLINDQANISISKVSFSSKLINDTNKLTVNKVLFSAKLKPGNTVNTDIGTIAVKQLPYKITDAASSFMVNSRGRLEKLVVSRIASIMSEQPIQKKETIQFWN